jgi:formylglycine-generating enzyme required for sulfatase activity
VSRAQTFPEASCGVTARVPTGVFWMGSDDRDPETAPDEQPRHLVVVGVFDLDIHEVANYCYERFVLDGGYVERAWWSETGWAWRARHTVSQPAFWGDQALRVPTHPVVGVSWFEADAYCRWRRGRLPTEAEWEKGARGADGQRYPWGAEWSPDHANGDVAVGRITPVGTYPRGVSPHGLHDMAGNVWEWVRDWYGKAFYVESPRSNPLGPATGDSRVLRGGAWNFPPRQLRAAARTHLPPETRIRYLGFRCAHDVSDAR